ncbi:MAG: metalloregulator ArsR/SmtB family transcription factor [Rhodothermales bacterium]
MAYSKSDQFLPDEIQLAEWAKALAHPARLAVLKVLAERKACICGEIVDVLPLAQATVSQHLKALKEAGFVQGTIEGPRSCYCLNPEALLRAREAFGAFFEHLDQASSCC